LLPAEDEGREYYEHVKQQFGNDTTLVIAIADENGAFSAENLRRIERLTDRIESMEWVDHVVSLANALNIRSQDGDLRIASFLETIPDDPAELAEIRREVLDNPVYAGNLVSLDGRVTALLVYLLDMPERAFLDLGVDEEIYRVAREESGDAAVWITGGAHVKSEVSRFLLADLKRLIPLIFLIMGVIALGSFRTIRGVAIPLATILIALIWTFGIAAELTDSLNLVTVVVPPLILVVGFAYAVHVVSEYYAILRHRRHAESENGPVFQALREVVLPVLLTGGTTAAGFLSLTLSPLDAIRQFGLFCTVGVLAAMIVSLTFAPALLQLLPTPRRIKAPTTHNRFDAALERLARFDLRHRGPILLAGAAIAVISLLGMRQIAVSTDMASNFKPDSRLRRHFDAINERLEGAGTLYVVLETGRDGAFLEPQNLEEIRKLQRWLETQPEVGGTTSLADYVMLIHRDFNDDDPAFFSIPDSKDLVNQLLLFAASSEMESFVDSGYQSVRVLIRSRAVESAEVAALLDRVEDRLSELPGNIVGRVTGSTALVTRTIDDIALGQALSLGSAFVIIFAILAMLFTSLRIGLIALIPNALPVIVYFGVLGLTGVTLNVTTGLVACLVLGIAVDDTIHLLVRFNAAARRRADESEGVVEAVCSVGRPVSYTSLALCLGFLALTTANLKNQVEFGALAAFILAFAWLVDMTFTPALAARLRIVTLWDILTVDLGQDPQRSIPLFQGLSNAQARIATLMASLQTFPKGHRLCQIGDEGDAMYVVIEGQLAASVPGEKNAVPLRVHSRGDLVGEVALFHGGHRTADVQALTDVRLVCLGHQDLERLHRRYPRIGARLYHNLSRILAGRLVSLTGRIR
jgi:predicted RND superfamily exporter protein